MSDLAEIDQQELRVAVVMNGGVSLAVWMGGVTRELDRLRRADGAYGALARLARTLPRIDVIAGSSAGGINGAVLAVAIARGSHVGRIRDIWMDDGSIEDLLRDPLRRDPPSLFLGDERLLAALRSALRAVASDRAGEAPGHPVQLTITGTTLQGEVKAYADHFGAVIPDVDHRARFRFRRGPVGEVSAGEQPEWPDDFEGTEALGQIALAARSSASFPVAFEPSFCPVGGDADEEHPDMRGPASFTQSRWVIDGGVLVNTPVRPALDAIASLPAERSVRRVLVYVVPDPGARTPKDDDRGTVPSPVSVALDSGSRLPRVQSIGRELEDIAANNKRVAKRRRARRCTLDDLEPGELEGAARALLHAYRCVRSEAAVADIVDRLLEGRRERDMREWREEAAKSSRDPLEPWRRAPSIAQVEAVRAELSGAERVPWLPDERTAWAESPTEHWRWGLAPVENAGNTALDILRSAIELEAVDHNEIRRLRGRLHEQLAALRRATRRNDDYWRGHEGLLDDPKRVPEVVAGWPLAGAAAEIALGLAGVLIDAGRLLAEVAADGGAETLRGRLRTLDVPATAPEGTVRRLLQLDVVQRASGAELAGIEQTIELVLTSADAGNAFDSRERAEEKLAGLQAAHFGSFYKRSWRANDWMWGRLDGADRLVRTLLDPRRIRRRIDAGAGPEELRAEIKAIAAPVGDEPGSALDDASRAWLKQRWDANAGRLLDELELLRADPAPTDLPLCHEALRRRLQLEVLVEEIGGVRDAARADLHKDTARGAAGATWQQGLPAGRLTGEAAVAAFTTCPIGEEQLPGEAGSDYFTSVATRTLGVAGSVAGGATAWKPLQPVLNTVRGVLLALYLLGRGVVSGSRTGNFAVALVLALGGALIALSLLGVDVPGLLTLLGATLLAAGALLGLVRGTPWRIALVVALYVATVAAYYGVQEWEGRPDWVDAVAVTGAVALLAVGATALGYQGRREAAN